MRDQSNSDAVGEGATKPAWHRPELKTLDVRATETGGGGVADSGPVGNSAGS